MAASGAEMSENSSSSEDEQLRRCQEAVWDNPDIKSKGNNIQFVARYGNYENVQNHPLIVTRIFATMS